jgi:rhodanese-related sulfurtransferase
MLAKFVVGLDAATPPLAGLSGTSRTRFVAFDAIGAALWSGVYAGLGYVLGRDLDRAAAYAARLGILWVLFLFAALAVYVTGKLVRWHRFAGEFRRARITPEELKEKLDAGEQVVIFDLHGRRDGPRGHQGIPGAVCIDAHSLGQHDNPKKPSAIPRDREVVLYCTTQREITSERAALQLRRRGFERVRPLAGGLKAWQERGFPMTSVILCGCT